ncbi:MAG: peptide chain release factor 2, partial [Helicobacteraceae bacterium]|nr:peptide chain release factor 2 [Helicobacteraceae bacterium]
MDAYEYIERIKKLQTQLFNAREIIKPDELKERLGEIGAIEKEQSFWLDLEKAAAVQKEKSRLEQTLSRFNEASAAVADALALFEIASDEQDGGTLEALSGELPSLEKKIDALEVELMLSNETDANNAIVNITPGAGGTESQDWASMLYRMYLRWAERRGFKSEILDYQDGEEAGIKDAAILIKGANAYGYLKVENGAHRLVRVSPFDGAARRHTSFAQVSVSPEIDDSVVIALDDKDLRIDTYRSSGAGGQHVNKTESAIRITHLPTGAVVQCQNDRSQHKNRETAFKMLRSKLYELEMDKRRAEASSAEKTEIGWGRQIRSYVLFPYKQVKDNRSKQAFSAVDAILDGDLDDLIEGVLVSLRRGEPIG